MICRAASLVSQRVGWLRVRLNPRPFRRNDLACGLAWLIAIYCGTEIIRQEEQRARDAQTGEPRRGIAQKNGPFEYRMASRECSSQLLWFSVRIAFPFVEACSPAWVRCCAAAEAQTFHKFELAWWRWSAARSGGRLYLCEDCRPGQANGSGIGMRSIGRRGGIRSVRVDAARAIRLSRVARSVVATPVGPRIARIDGIAPIHASI